MSFQAYLYTIEEKTGKIPQDFIDLAKEKGFDQSTKAQEIINWLAEDFNLGRGHAMAIVHIIKNGAVIDDKHVNSGGTHSDSSDTLDLMGKRNRQ